jgi:hypothetical protein
MGRNNPPTSQKYWFDLALFYCSKRETSRSRLKAYFTRKIREYRAPEESIPETLVWIENVLLECERLKIIDHERYAGILHREYQRRGKGKRYITQKFHERGLKEEVEKLSFDQDEELDRAIALAMKNKERSTIKKLTDPYQIRTKLLQKLVSSGFELSTAKKAIDVALKSS